MTNYSPPSELDLEFSIKNATTPEDLVRVALEVREACSHYGAIKAVYEKMRGQIEYGLIPEMWMKQDLQTVTFADLGVRVTVKHSLKATMAGDKDHIFSYLRNAGHGEAIVEQVNASALSRIAREMMKDGLELPADLFKTEPTTSTSMTKVKAK